MANTIIEQSFTNQMSENMKKLFASAFEESQFSITPNRHEIPIHSIQRVLGPKFYDLSETKFDVMTLVMEVAGTFNRDELKLNENFPKINNIINFIANIFKAFSDMNGGEVVFTKEFIASAKVPIHITSEEKGLISSEITLEQLKPIANVDENGNITGFKYFKDIAELENLMAHNHEAFEKINKTNPMTAESIQKQQIELGNKLRDLLLQITDSFFSVFKDVSGVEDEKSIYDIQFHFARSFKDPEGKEKDISELVVFSYHDISAYNLRAIKHQFFLD